MLTFKNTYRLFLAIGCAFLLSMAARAQSPHIRKISFPIPGKEPSFSKMLQDKEGYLWLGSENGLFRFDGISFKQYFSPLDTVEFHVTALYESSEGILWIGCNDGKIYRLENGIVSLFNPEEGTAGKPISDILTDKDGVTWWSTHGEGIYFYYNKRVYNIDHDDGLNDDYVYDLECDHSGVTWAGTDGGVAACSQAEGRKDVRPLSKGISLPDIIVKVIKEDESGRLWLGFQDEGTGYLLADRSGFVKPYPAQMPVGPVQDLACLEDEIWLATASGELLEIDMKPFPGKIPGISKIDYNSFGMINDLLEDREGNVWVLSHTGLFRTTGTRLKFFDKYDHGNLLNIHSIRYDQFKPDHLWFSNDDGLFLLDLTNGNSKKYLEGFRYPNLKVMCLFQDRLGFIWAGTFNYGLIRLNPDNGTWIQLTEEQGLVNNNVLSISGHNDSLWMATLGGASEIILKGNAPDGPFDITSHNSENGLANNFIYSVFEDNHDQIWFATDGDGINVLTKSGWISYGEKNGLDDDVIYSITGDKNEDIWIASASSGIYKYTEGRFSRIGIKEGLSSLEITGIATADDEVVIVDDDGINILHIPTERVSNYGEESGVAGIFPDLNVLNKDPYGNIWIGTRTGIIRYQPGTDRESYGPETVLEELSVFMEPRAMVNDLTLRYDENHVSFKYAGLWYSNPEKVTYQVILEGYDINWKNTYDRSITFSSLQPGDYTFRVRSSLNESFRNASEASYHFIIKRPFWFRAWFIILIALLFAAVIYLVVRYREERMRRIEQQKKEKVEFEFQVLKNQVNPHFLFNSFSTLMSLIEEQPGQALQYTEKLSDFFRTILQLKDQNVIPIKEELELVESYYFIQKKRFGNNLNLEISLDKEVKNSVIPPMTLQILIENAIKHNIISKDKPLSITIYEEGRKIVVENNLQPKKAEEISTGIGLENIKKRYRLITLEEVVIESMEEVFRVKLPVLR